MSGSARTMWRARAARMVRRGSIAMLSVALASAGAIGSVSADGATVSGSSAGPSLTRVSAAATPQAAKVDRRSVTARTATSDRTRAERVRLGGASRYETAAAIVAWRARGPIPAGPKLRLVSGTRPLDAVAYGKDAVPTLYVPPVGAVPEEVGAAYRLVRPSVVEVVGSEAQLPTRQVRAVIGGARFQRLKVTDASRVSWTAAVRAADWGHDESFTDMPPVALVSPRVLAEAAAAVQARNWFAVVVPRSGSLPAIPVYPTPTFTTTAAVVGGKTTLGTAQRRVLFRGHHGVEWAEFGA